MATKLLEECKLCPLHKGLDHRNMVRCNRTGSVAFVLIMPKGNPAKEIVYCLKED